jgi:polyribonucleotide nucleotidyltransferase
VNSIKKSVQYGDHILSLETGKIARQAGGAIIASLGETSVMVTAVGKKISYAWAGFLSVNR